MIKSTVFQRAKTKLVTTEPFYATIVLSMKVVETDKRPDGQDLWLAATNGATLWINPDNVEKLTVPQAVGLLKHEALHVAFLHPWRVGNRNHRAWNQATDYIINDIITKEHGELPEGGRMRDGVSETETAESVYASLPPGGQDSGGGQGDGGGDPFDGDLLPAETGGESAQVSEMQAKALVAKAANIAKAQGRLPAGIKHLIEELFVSRIPWEDQLRQFLTEVARADYTFARPNRRFVAQGTYLPGMYSEGAMRKLGVIIDTSGSIGTDELSRFFGEVVGAIDAACPSQLIVVYCDCEINAVDRLDNPTEDDVRTNARREGGGGTDMTVAQRWFEENEPDTAAVMVFTDGYTPFADSPIHTLWCITTDVQSPHGQTLHVDLSEV